MPPETFLPDEAPGPVIGTQPTMEEIVWLSSLGTPAAPSDEEALAVLRRARRTVVALEAAHAVLCAEGPVSERLRIEAAFLFASNGSLALAMDALHGVMRPRRRIAMPAPDEPEPRPLPRPLVSVTSAAITREIAFQTKMRALFPVTTGPVYEPLPPEIDTQAPPPSSAGDIEAGDVEVERIVRLGKPGGPTADEVCTTLLAARGTGDGVRALRNVLVARDNGPLPVPVRSLAAEMLVELGDRDAALAALEGAPEPAPAPEPPGIDVDADLAEADAARRAAEAERVIARDATRLGVPERLGRFRAVARAARITLDTFRALGGRGKQDEAREAARELEEAGEHGRAGEMYALGGHDGDARRVGVSGERPPPGPGTGEAGAVLAEIDALDRRGLRLAAVRAARAFLLEHDDAEVAAFARGVAARLARGPVVAMVLDGREERVVLGDVVTIGRAGATIDVPSPLVSRVHLRLSRRDGTAIVEDLGSHNGTWLAGARLAAPLPVGAGVDLAIGREIPCSIRARDDGALALDVAGERYVLSLGPLRVAGATIALADHGDEHVVELRPPASVGATLGDLPLETAIELARGDVVKVGAATTLSMIA